MLIKFILSFFLLIPLASWSNEISLSVVHPAKGKRAEYSYEIHCKSQCHWTLTEGQKSEGDSSRELFEQDILGLLELVKSKEIPAKQSINKKQSYLKVTVTEEKKPHHFELALPGAYKGNDLSRFTKINDYILRVEFNLKREKVK